MDGARNMNKYDTMLAVNKKRNKRKIDTAKKEIYKMLENGEKVTVTKLIDFCNRIGSLDRFIKRIFLQKRRSASFVRPGGGTAGRYGESKALHRKYRTKKKN